MTGSVWDGIEALAALERWGTVTEAAARLELTQSAVSKRLQALQREVGHPILAPDGRRVVLTAAGQDLLDRARPLLTGLLQLTARPRTSLTHWSFVLDDDVAGSWGPRAVASAARAFGRLRLELHAHRGNLLTEQVRSGRYHLGLTTEPEAPTDLLHDPIVHEPMVLLHAGLGRKAGRGPLLTVESDGPTWRAIAEPLAAAHPTLAARERTPTASFAAVRELAVAGFGDGLLPLGHVVDADLPKRSWAMLDVARPVSLVTRRTVGSLSAWVDLRDTLRETAERRLLGDKGKRGRGKKS